MTAQTIRRARLYDVDDATAQAQRHTAPRCPLCGIVLDMTVTPHSDGTATFTLTDRSAGHVTAPHRARQAAVLLEVVQ